VPEPGFITFYLCTHVSFSNFFLGLPKIAMMKIGGLGKGEKREKGSKFMLNHPPLNVSFLSLSKLVNALLVSANSVFPSWKAGTSCASRRE
jgi:hypothetical protein